MKKIYKNPVLEVVKIQTQQIIAASVNASISDITSSNEDALTREDGFDFGDDAFDFGAEEPISNFE